LLRQIYIDDNDNVVLRSDNDIMNLGYYGTYYYIEYDGRILEREWQDMAMDWQNDAMGNMFISRGSAIPEVARMMKKYRLIQDYLIKGAADE